MDTLINPDISYGFYRCCAIRSLTALRLFGRLDILSNMPALPSLRAHYTPDRRARPWSLYILSRIPKLQRFFCGLKGRRITAQGKGACAVALARIFHTVSTDAAQSGMSTALRLFGRLDILSNMSALPSRRAPCIYARLRTTSGRNGMKYPG